MRGPRPDLGFYATEKKRNERRNLDSSFLYKQYNIKMDHAEENKAIDRMKLEEYRL
jgi:hypothetical protein